MGGIEDDFSRLEGEGVEPYFCQKGAPLVLIGRSSAAAQYCFNDSDSARWAPFRYPSCLHRLCACFPSVKVGKVHTASSSRQTQRQSPNAVMKTCIVVLASEICWNALLWFPMQNLSFGSDSVNATPADFSLTLQLHWT